MKDDNTQGTDGMAPQGDLRTELFEDLSVRFTVALKSDGSIPVAAQDALVELLSSQTPTAAQIIAASSESDPEEEEADQ